MSLLLALKALKITITNGNLDIDWDIVGETFSDREIKIFLSSDELIRILRKYRTKSLLKIKLGKLLYKLEKEEKDITKLSEQFDQLSLKDEISC